MFQHELLFPEKTKRIKDVLCISVPWKPNLSTNNSHASAFNRGQSTCDKCKVITQSSLEIAEFVKKLERSEAEISEVANKSSQKISELIATKDAAKESTTFHTAHHGLRPFESVPRESGQPIHQ